MSDYEKATLTLTRSLQAGRLVRLAILTRRERIITEDELKNGVWDGNPATEPGEPELARLAELYGWQQGNGMGSAYAPAAPGHSLAWTAEHLARVSAIMEHCQAALKDHKKAPLLMDILLKEDGPDGAA